MAKSKKKEDQKNSQQPGTRQDQKDATHFKAQEIIKSIEEGASLRKSLILKGMSSSTFYKWLERDEKNEKQYARACNMRADILFDEIINIADDNTLDTITIINAQGKEVKVEDKEWVNRSKLRVDARKWALSKMNPKKYGDKIEHEVKNDVTVSFK